MERIPNALAQSTSPYLLQHAFNPVQWFPWGDDALRKAREENKLIIVSVGYSACHWCHVMEHESFEDEEVATVMNRSFVCIKVDREERPDIDQLYMDAVQLMTGRGGWPLNVITLPDQRPLYGGTYFPKEQWRSVLLQVAAFWRNDPAKCFEYAEELLEGMQRLARVKPLIDDGDNAGPDFSDMLHRWSAQWDRAEGGHLRAPKFPMPDGLRFLQAAATITGHTDARDHVLLTLQKISMGGIRDQVGGGFARYSTDLTWKVPHFEKMLYDNAQLIACYAEAFKQSGDSRWCRVAEDTLRFVERELTSPSGGFYSALDADSEGVEGKYYCWNPDELTQLFGDEAPLVIRYFNINEFGYWEEDRYIPLRREEDHAFAAAAGMPLSLLLEKAEGWKQQLLLRRAQRVRPGLDDKILCSWNALMLSACFHAYTATGREDWRKLAERNIDFLLTHCITGGDTLWHAVHEKSGQVRPTVPGFLEDYAFVIEALLHWQAILPERPLAGVAGKLIQTVLREFADEASGFFWFTPRSAAPLVTRRQEVQDNVIPSSNAVMMHNLLRWARLTGDRSQLSRVLRTLRTLRDDIERSTPWYSRWALVWLELEQGTEIEVHGPQGGKLLQELLKEYLPLSVVSLHLVPGTGATAGARYRTGETLIYVCRSNSCLPPVKDSAAAVALALRPVSPSTTHENNN